MIRQSLGKFTLTTILLMVFGLHAAADLAPAGEAFHSAGFARAPEGALDIANVPAPLFRDPVFDGAADPSVVWNAREKAWYVFYTQRRATHEVPAGGSWFMGTKIGITKSTDEGRTWSYVGTAKGMSRGLKDETFWAPHVFEEKGIYHMFVTYIPKVVKSAKGQPVICHYTSKDMVTWEYSDTVDVKSDDIIDPAVVKLRDGRWLMVFRDCKRQNRTAKVVSADLKNWERLEELTGDCHHEAPVVVFWKNKFWLFIDEWKGLGVYESEDGINYKTFDIRVHALTMQTPQPETWLAAIEKQTADAASDWEKHLAWWSEFWSRSWISCSDNTVPAEQRERLNGEATGDRRAEEDGAAVVAQSYNIFRFLMACQSRGRVQAKFNGGLFTQQLRGHDTKNRTAPTRQADGTFLTHEDDRLWGRRFTYQNQRLLYWPLLASGDFEMIKPFFDYYSNLLPMRQAITKAWFGHDGAYYRENIEPTGAERDCGENGKPPKTQPGENKGQGYYHSYYFTSGLETTAMMLDYVHFTGDTAFRDKVLVPFAREVLLFFDEHYSRGPDGKLRIDPAMVLETWWIAVNPAPDVAGLQFCLDELLAMKAGTSDDQAQWSKFRAEIPDLHMQTIDGRQSIAPALKWEKRVNQENGELYPVFPFRRFGLALGTADIVAETMKHRTSKDAFGCICWTQDQIHWAYAGNASEAARGLVRRFRSASPMCRFPLYGREHPDSCPDFDHFGAGSVALQRMLVQEAGGKILLLPAWPATWDTEFKLHLSQRTVISGTVKDGKLVSWNIQPASRKNDVTVCQPQSATYQKSPPSHQVR